MMNVLVTGAVGNVGYITATVCAEAGLEVVAHDRLKCEPSLADAAGAVVDAIKGGIPGAQLEVGPGLNPWSDFHVPRGSFDITRAEKELGFKVQFPLKKAISDYADWLRDKI